MNWANRLTLSRGFLTVLFVVALSTPMAYGNTAALILFLLGGVTDYLDGEIARRYKMTSDFGRLMDPLVDKIMVASAFICLVTLHLIPAWAVVIIISREFAITGLRLLAASKNQILSAEKLGKHKTAWQMITIVYYLAILAFREFGGTFFDAPWTERLGHGLIAITLGFTVYSGFGYVWKHRDLISGN